MNNKLILRWITGGVLVWGLSACSTIKSWFPDKERDYQFTSEIPELIVPDDLKNKGLAALSAQPTEATHPAETPASEAESVSGSRYPTETETVTTTAQAGTAEPEAATVDSSVETEAVKSPDENEVKPIEQPGSSTGVSSLHIDQSKNQAVRMVGRALTRQKLEVVERNIDKGYFYVKFDPDAVKVSDESIWDELNFFFGDDPSQEQEYRITVQQIGQELSQVTVQDSEGVSLSNEAANALLKLITDGINEVVSPDASTDAPVSEAESEQETPENPVKQE